MKKIYVSIYILCLLLFATNINADVSIENKSSAGGLGDVVGPSVSSDGELPLFDSTTGKLLKRSNTLSGVALLTSGVVSALSTDGTGDCASGSVCLGDHTHSTYGSGDIESVGDCTTGACAGPITVDIIGNVTGNLTGDVVGDVTGTASGNLTSSSISDTALAVSGESTTVAPSRNQMERFVKAITVQTISSCGAATTFDANEGNIGLITLDNASACDFDIINPTEGQIYTFYLIQSGSTRLITWPDFKWESATAPTLSTTTAYVDMVQCMYVSSVFRCGFLKDLR